jgi:hypothetical protein
MISAALGAADATAATGAGAQDGIMDADSTQQGKLAANVSNLLAV